ncbi:MAG: FKBP-type peptidyl-prolyl cis-trans isomerase [Bacteroidales bacterium]|nr:FKBP-type peptidyl-prolyl cis-trans isomerase [Bacteroidales bacterium]
MITVNKSVVLHYNLKEDNSEGQLIESTYTSEPLEFVFGSGKMIPMFEDMLEGKMAGDKFAFSIPVEQAYGEINSAAVMDLDITVFEYHGKVDYEMVRVGNVIPMRDSNGHRIDGKVLEMDETKVKIDFNHPLAGKNLYFEGEVLSVEDYEEHEHHHHHHHDDGGCGCGSGCGCH